MGHVNLNLLMAVSKMKLKQKEEQTIDTFAHRLYKLSYWLVILTCFGFFALFLLFLFGDYIGLVYKDQDVVEWCEEYNPTWTYEQCESRIGR